MYGWTNSEGEPIMDGAAYRFEQALDADYADQRHMDDDYYGSFDCDGCEDDEDYAIEEFGESGCPSCGLGGTMQDDLDGMEDFWLDGSYEE